MSRTEIVPFKPAHAKQLEALPGKVLFNRDEGRLVKKPLIYVFDAEDLAKHVASDADPNTVINISCVCVGMPANCVEQVANPAASGKPTGQYVTVRIESVKSA